MKNRTMVFAAIAAALAVTACGGNGTTAQTTAAQTAAAVTTTAETTAAPETTAAAATAAETEPAAEVTSAPAAEKTKETYTSKDGWSVDYPTSLITVSEADGETHFVYTGECAGSDLIAISYLPEKQPREVLYEKTANCDPADVVRSEGWFGGFPDNWSFTYSIQPKTTEGSGLQEQYTAIEHNGGVLLIDCLTHRETDKARSMEISDTISGVLDTLRFDHHEPQQEFAYVPGTYQCSRNEEIEGKPMTFTDTIVLNQDHTGTMSIQDDVEIYWTSTNIVQTQSGDAHEYTVEGDSLMVNMDGNWVTFDKVPASK